jgi:hypothetical protein
VRKALAAAFIAATILAGTLPSSASMNGTVNGTVRIPTMASPSPARMLWLATGVPTGGATNGILGWVVPVPPASSGYTTFSLSKTGGLTQEEDFAITFYDQAFLDPIGTQVTCNFAHPGNESGNLQGDPNGVGSPSCNFYPSWAVVTLAVGLQGTFQLTFS